MKSNATPVDVEEVVSGKVCRGWTRFLDEGDVMHNQGQTQ